MRGITIEDCPEQTVEVGRVYKIVRGLIPIPYIGECDLVFGLGNPDTENLVWCPPCTCLEVVQVPEKADLVVLGDLLMSTTYQGHRREQKITDPPVLCLEFVRIPSSQVIKPWDLIGAEIQVKGAP